jgi:hypothetical protein
MSLGIASWVIYQLSESHYGRQGAIRWAIVCTIHTCTPGLHLLEERYFTDDPDLARLNLGYRLDYKLAGAFKMVPRAHRIVYYQL